MKHQTGLVKGIGFLALIASCFNCTVGGGIFRLPATIFSIAGNLSLPIYVLCFLVMLFVVGVFIQVGSSIQVSGGPYAYVKPVLGNYFGFICGVLLWFLATFAFASISNAYAHFVALLLPGSPTPLIESMILGITLSGLALFNSFGVKSGAKLSLFLALIKILPLLFLIAIGLPHLQSSTLTLPESWDASSLSRGAMILIFAFTGMESALIPSGEIANPEKTIPRALLISSTLVLFLYLGVHSVSQSVLGSELAQEGISPLALAASKILGSSGGAILSVGAVFSTLGYLSALTMSLPRSLFAFSENGYLPRFISTLSPTTQVPVSAIWIQVAIVYGLAITNQFEKLAVLANLSAILMYSLCAVAAILVLQRSGKSLFKAGLIPITALITMSFLLTSVTLEEWVSVLSLLFICSIGYGLRNKILGPKSLSL